MSEWYWMKDGQKQGPVDTARLKRMAQTGQLQPTDMIWRDGLPNWVSASQAKGMEFGVSRSDYAGSGGTSVATAQPRAVTTQRPAATGGIIRYRCAQCGGILESERYLAGKHENPPPPGRAARRPEGATQNRISYQWLKPTRDQMAIGA